MTHSGAGVCLHQKQARRTPLPRVRPKKKIKFCKEKRFVAIFGTQTLESPPRPSPPYRTSLLGVPRRSTCGTILLAEWSYIPIFHRGCRLPLPSSADSPWVEPFWRLVAPQHAICRSPGPSRCLGQG